ncbi:MAG TPA: DeoR/GlpR family DNA-binding transcription regulator [Chthoniobacterales bacterium]
MKVPLHLVEARRQQLAALLQQRSYLPIQEVCSLLQVSEATARRDLRALAREKRIVRTFGGAVSDFNQRFASFRERQTQFRDAKNRIAAGARQLVQPSTTIYLDAGTTVAALAEALRHKPVTPLRVVTHSLPAAETLAGVEGVTVFLTGGHFLNRQSILLGPEAGKALAFYTIDVAFLGAEAADKNGVWNSTEEVVHHQQIALKRARHHALCLDASKFGHTAPAFLKAWSGVETLVTDLPETELLKLASPIPKQVLHT